MIKIKPFAKLFLPVILLILPGSYNIYSQELEPRAYTNIPTGLNFVLAGYSYSAGGVVFDPTIPLENADIHIHGTVLAWARSVKVGPMSGKVDVIMPYGWLSGSAEFDGQEVTRVVSGLADPRIRMSFNFIGAPALPLGIHHSLKFSLSTGVSTRTGSDYDVAQLLWQYRWGKGLPNSKRS